MVVEVARARERGATACERAGQQLLGPGLAHAAGDRDDVGRAPLPRTGGQGAKPVVGIDDQQQRRALRAAPPAGGSPSPPRPRARTPPARSRGRRGWGRRGQQTDRPPRRCGCRWRRRSHSRARAPDRRWRRQPPPRSTAGTLWRGRLMPPARRRSRPQRNERRRHRRTRWRARPRSAPAHGPCRR